MNSKDVPMPDRLKNFPLWRGYVVFHTVFIGPDGNPDFKVIDDRKRRNCLHKQLCGICGQQLEDVIALIGGPSCVQNRVFLDGPMHKECALYAAKVCPFLSNSEVDYSRANPKHLEDGTVIRTYEHVNPRRPDRLAVYYCRSYEMIFTNGAWHCKAGKPIRVDWNVMPKIEKVELCEPNP